MQSILILSEHTSNSALPHSALCGAHGYHLLHILYVPFLRETALHAGNLGRGASAGETLYRVSIRLLDDQRASTKGFSCRKHANVENNLGFMVVEFRGELMDVSSSQ
jgi:hypothetical protein